MEREAFLARLASSAGAVALPTPLPPTMVSGDAAEEPVERFVRELALVGGEARRVPASALDVAVGAALAGCATAIVGPDLGEHTAAVERGLERAGCRAVPAGRPSAESAAAGITGAVLGVASTGSVLISSTAGSRTTSLLPPTHVVVLPQERLLPGFEELFEHLPALAAAASQLVLVTGPSRTADIEMTLVHGVHGPERVVVLVVPS